MFILGSNIYLSVELLLYEASNDRIKLRFEGYHKRANKSFFMIRVFSRRQKCLLNGVTILK